MRFRILRFPDPAEGSNPPADPPSTDPAAAKIVLTGERTERETQLQQELDAVKEEKKKVETKNAELQDQLNTLTTPTKARRGLFRC